MYLKKSRKSSLTKLFLKAGLYLKNPCSKPAKQMEGVVTVTLCSLHTMLSSRVSKQNWKSWTLSRELFLKKFNPRRKPLIKFSRKRRKRSMLFKEMRLPNPSNSSSHLRRLKLAIAILLKFPQTAMR